VTLAAERDLRALRTGLERWLGRPVGEITRPAPGWSCETVIVEGRLVIRLPPMGDGIFPVYDLAQQSAVQHAVASAGIPVASPVEYEANASFFDAPFLTMPFVAGPIPSEFTVADPWLQSLPKDAQHRVWRSLVDTLAVIHGVPVEGLGLRTGLDAEFDFWAGYLNWATDGAPPAGLVDALDWCRANRPTDEPPVGLLWGDARLGNVVFDPDTLAPKAVLDWDMTSAGPVEMDLAWFLALEQLQTDLTGTAVAGFGTREEAVAAVEEGVGRTLEHLEWYEIFALVRASAVSSRIAILFERDGRPSVFRSGEDPTYVAATARIAAAGAG